MEFSNLFKDSLKYPTKNLQILVIFGIIVIFANLKSIYDAFGGTQNQYLIAIFGIISLILGFIVSGYILSIIKNTIEGSDIVPQFQWKDNFIMGIKYLILNIIYAIIPAIIILLVLFATGSFSSMASLVSYSQMGNTAMVNAVAQNMAPSILITSVVAIILFIIFGILCTIAECRLAISGSISDGLKVKEIINDLSNIGWGNFIVWAIISIIILFVISIIYSVVAFIPIIGFLISLLLISPFMAMFTARAMGLMYASK